MFRFIKIALVALLLTAPSLVHASMLPSKFDQVAAHGPDLAVESCQVAIYKTTVSGHARCMAHTGKANQSHRCKADTALTSVDDFAFRSTSSDGRDEGSICISEHGAPEPALAPPRFG